VSTYRIGVIVGSLSRNSINRQLARALEKLAPATMEFEEIEIGNLPLYNHDFDGDGWPEAATAFKEQINSKDGYLIVTPEYSRSIPAALKNALEYVARPYGQNSFNNKPVAVTGTSMGAISTAVAQQHLKTILSHLNAQTFGQPEAFVQFLPSLIDADYNVTNEGTKEFLNGFLAAFEQLLTRAAK